MAKKAKKTRASQQSGFTLIELLAVITIMGILMMVAIPAISRTIENSRRDTFKNTAQQYVSAIKNEVSSDAILCNTAAAGAAAKWESISAVETGTGSGASYTPYVYVYKFDSSNSTGQDLMDQGGKSSWGNADVKGNVSIIKEVVKNGEVSTVKYTYYVKMVDKAGRGIKTNTQDTALTRSDVQTSGSDTDYNTAQNTTTTGTARECKIAG